MAVNGMHYVRLADGRPATYHGAVIIGRLDQLDAELGRVIAGAKALAGATIEPCTEQLQAAHHFVHVLDWLAEQGAPARCEN